MAKKVLAYIKLQVKAGEANPSPPVGPALGQHGVNIMEFCKSFNAKTQNIEKGLPTPVVITVYADRSFHLCHQDPTRINFIIESRRVLKKVVPCRIPIRLPRLTAIN